ncbi:M23 family metallopeptidase [Romboutsia ilealis]|uniref:M23 family metallopeptidase n=1 Tax=Romboutsia ilealis TaxID=1115758 RepID=UPI0025B79B8E|nr:M23 family metallopeptidase [Romboutsia ilealis]
MKKYISFLIVFVSIVLGFYICKKEDSNVYAIESENKIELLIANKDIQKKLSLEIENLQNEINLIEESENNNNNQVEVVTVSFIQESIPSKEYIEETELEVLVKKKSELVYKLQEYIIESIKLEKQIEEEKKEELSLNNTEYLKGIWPVKSYREISSPFGDRIHPITGKQSFHKGIDIPAPQDTDIVSCDDGIVSFSGVMNGYGNVIKIKHFDGKETLYAHNNSNIVEKGDIVKSGQVIAKIGTTGNSTGNHLHFETIINNKNINPINVVN